MRRLARWLVVIVVVLDLGFVALLLTDGIATVQAQSPAVDSPESGEGEDEDENQAIPSPETLLQLGQEIAAPATELDRRETEMTELIRGNEVLRRAGLLPEEPAQPAETAQPSKQAKQEPSASSAAFQSLQKAYEKMEPESAASALVELAARDKRVVIELMLGWNSRTSGPILDSLTQRDPKLAADLSYEIWKMGNSTETP